MEAEYELDLPAEDGLGEASGTASDLAQAAMHFASTVAVLAMVFGGVVPFVPQYAKVVRTRSCEGFSTDVILTLLTAYILRIFFWIGHPFETPLLLQCGVMIAMLLALQRACLNCEPSSSLPTMPVRFSLRNLSWSHLWRWSYFSDYLAALGSFVLAFACLTWLLQGVGLFVELTGLASLLLEALLGLPQFLSNFRNRSTRGMSVAMVGCWLSGDIFKTGYYLARHAPLQFPLCGCLQICVDLAILYQVFSYGEVASKQRQRTVHAVPVKIVP